MLTFTQKVFERGLTGTGSVYSPVDTYELLGSADKWFIQARVTQPAGTSPKLTVQLEESADGETWTAISTPINNVSLTVNDTTHLFGTEAGNTPSGRLVRIRTFLGGTTPSAYVEIWGTGRAKRSRGIPRAR